MKAIFPLIEPTELLASEHAKRLLFLFAQTRSAEYCQIIGLRIKQQRILNQRCRQTAARMPQKQLRPYAQIAHDILRRRILPIG